MSSSHANRHAPEPEQGAVQPCESRSPCTYAEVARELGVDAGTLSKWVAQARPSEEGAGDSDNPSRMAEDLRKLRRSWDAGTALYARLGTLQRLQELPGCRPILL